MVQQDRIFSDAAFRWVDLILAAMAVALAGVGRASARSSPCASRRPRHCRW